MNSKKFSIFACLLAIIMSIVSVFIAVSYKGKDGMSAYELAKQSGQISSSMTELEYLESLRGKNGSNISLKDVYDEYVKIKKAEDSSFSLSYEDFVLNYSNLIKSEGESLSEIEYATQNGLRSTVDICYSYYMQTETIYVAERILKSTNENVYVIDESKTNIAESNAAAGAGVIYKMDDNTAYIITNYHVVYVENYTNDDTYRVYADTTSGSYFTAKYDESMIETTTSTSTSFPFQETTAKYIKKSEIEKVKAPIETHFLDSYGIYLYGYQDEKYEISASFVGGSADNDIAILKVDKNESKANELLFTESYKAASIGESSKLVEGKTVVAIGNPLIPSVEEKDYTASEFAEVAKQAYVDALVLTSTSGEVSNLSEYCMFASLLDSTKANSMRLIRVSAAINSGNSGGGLYSTDGKLVGIVNGKIASDKYDNVGYAIPVEIATRIADRVILECNGSSKTRIKTLSAENLGISSTEGESNAYYDEGENLSFVLSKNIIVSSAKGSAYQAGLREEDIIRSIEIDGKTYEVHELYNIDDILINAKYKAGSVKFNIVRKVDSQPQNLSVTINYTESLFEEVI